MDEVGEVRKSTSGKARAKHSFLEDWPVGDKGNWGRGRPLTMPLMNENGGADNADLVRSETLLFPLKDPTRQRTMLMMTTRDE